MKISHGIVIGMSLIFSFCYSQEIQIPIDQENRVEFIDVKLAAQLDLFRDFENFQEARLFQISDTSFVLEIYHRLNNRTLKVRQPMTDSQVRELQVSIYDAIHQKSPRLTMDQKGRSRFLKGTLTLALGYWSWAVPVTLGVDDGKTGAALSMFTLGGGYYIPYSITQNRPVSEAAATLSLYGGSRGIAHGICLACLFVGEPEAQAVIGMGLLASIAETAAGFQIANQYHLTPGDAEVIGVGGDFGMGISLGVAHLLDFYEHDTGRATCVSVLAGYGIGSWWGNRLSKSQRYTDGDARILNTAGFLGAYLPLALVDLMEPDEDKVYTTTAMVGAVIGLGIGNRMVKGMDFTGSQGNLIRYSTWAGGFLGLGMAYLLTDENEDNSTAFLISGAVGASLGFGLMYGSQVEEARVAHQSNDERVASRLNVRIHPEGMLAMALPKSGESKSRLARPLFSMQYRF